MASNLLSVDEAIETAFDIFYEMVEDNLEPSDLDNYYQYFDLTGAAIALPPAADWENQIAMAFEPEHFFEIQIGLAENSEQLTTVLVRMLLSRDPNEKFCHLLWKR